MKLEDVSFGFVIISPEHNAENVAATVKSVKLAYKDAPAICVVRDNTSDQNVDNINKLCTTHVGGKSVSSLVNEGIEKNSQEWNILLMEGSCIRRGFVSKIFKFIESDLDVVYPIVVDRNRSGRPIRLYTNFYNTTLDGLTIHRDAFKKAGSFSDDSLHISKVQWAAEAMSHGCNFKAVLGARYAN